MKFIRMVDLQVILLFDKLQGLHQARIVFYFNKIGPPGQPRNIEGGFLAWKMTGLL